MAPGHEYKRWSAYIKENRDCWCSEVFEQYKARWHAYATRIDQLERIIHQTEYGRQQAIAEARSKANDKRKRDSVPPQDTETTPVRNKKPRKSQKRRKRKHRGNSDDSPPEDDPLHLEYDDKDPIPVDYSDPDENRSESSSPAYSPTSPIYSRHRLARAQATPTL